MPSNILLITADDMDVATPATFGGPAGVTPTIDALARSGMVFHRAHVAAAVCQPSRSAIMTGLFPHRNGAEGFERIADGVTLLTEPLRSVGYHLGILGKVAHLQPVERFGWDLRVDVAELGMGRDPRRYGEEAARFFDAAAAHGQPWFLMANAHDPHRPFHSSAQEQEKFSSNQRRTIPAPSRIFAPDEQAVPGFLPDLPGIRTEYAQYLASARRCDDVVAAVLGALAGSPGAAETVVIFLSDNGMAFPFAKANCYLQSTRTPFIVRWPGVTKPGSADRESFISMIDLFPTICAAAGLSVPPGLDGMSLLPLLQGDRSVARERVLTVFHETSAKKRFEMRCVQDARFGYIWNAWSDGTEEYAAENMEGLSWAAMRAASPDRPEVGERVAFYRHRCPEELYDLVKDPFSLHDLARDAEWSGVLEGQRSALAAWMDTTADPLRERYRSSVLAE